MNRRTTFALVFTMYSGACSTPGGEFPSLSRRPFENGLPIEAPVVAPVPVADRLPGQFADEVGALTARHRSAMAAYQVLLPSARRVAAAASGSAQSSEAWVNAHLVVSRLDHARADSTAALAQLDNLVAQRLDAEAKGAFPQITTLLLPVQTSIAADVAAQNAEIERLSLLVGL
jgi:hypothetical protein